MLCSIWLRVRQWIRKSENVTKHETWLVMSERFSLAVNSKDSDTPWPRMARFDWETPGERTYLPYIHDSSFNRTGQKKPSLLISRFWFIVEPSHTRLQNVLVQDASLRPLTWTSCIPGLVGLISCPKENKQKRRKTFVFSSSARTLLATKLRVFPELEIWWLWWSAFWEAFIVVIGALTWSVGAPRPDKYSPFLKSYNFLQWVTQHINKSAFRISGWTIH